MLFTDEERRRLYLSIYNQDNGVAAVLVAILGRYFGARYFGGRYFGQRYFG